VKRLSVAIIGAGRWGGALAMSLRAAGYRISEIVSRRGSSPTRFLVRSVGTEVTTNKTAVLDADVVWFCVPDAQITTAARQLSKRNWNGKIALHSSGVLSSDVLVGLREEGARVASVHPLMTFVKAQSPDLTGVSFAVEGDPQAVAVANAIVRELGGKPIPIRARDKLAYHAFATMVCPLLISLVAASEKVAALAGISPSDARRRMLPIIRQTIANYEKLGAAGSFTGPLVRGDVETVRHHLDALADIPDARSVYIKLAEAALKSLPNRHAKEMQAALCDILSGGAQQKSKALNRKARKGVHKVR